MTKTASVWVAFACFTAGSWASSAQAAMTCLPLPYIVDVESTEAGDKADSIWRLEA
jgi:hypothetical protein